MTQIILRTARHPYALLGLAGILLAILALAADFRAAVADVMPGWYVWQVATGTALVAAMAYQWLLLAARLARHTPDAQRRYRWHRWVGAGMTLVFVLHAVRFGYGWNSTLAVVFLLAAASGLMNRELVPYRTRGHYLIWFGVHVALSALLVPLTALHVWVALAYEGTR